MKAGLPHTGTGLCSGCRWMRLVRNRLGSGFVLCRRGLEDPGFAKYPRLPVLKCRGFEPGLEDPERAVHQGPRSTDDQKRGGAAHSPDSVSRIS